MGMPTSNRAVSVLSVEHGLSLQCMLTTDANDRLDWAIFPAA